MIRTGLVSLVAFVGLIGIGMADEKAKPHGPAPQFMVVTDVSRAGVTLKERTPGPEKAELYRERVYNLDFVDVQTLDAAGKQLTEELFRKRVAAEPVVLVFAEKVEPGYCRVVREGTVVLVVKRGKLKPSIESDLIEPKLVPEVPPAKSIRR